MVIFFRKLLLHVHVSVPIGGLLLRVVLQPGPQPACPSLGQGGGDSANGSRGEFAALWDNPVEEWDSKLVPVSVLRVLASPGEAEKVAIKRHIRFQKLQSPRRVPPLRQLGGDENRRVVLPPLQRRLHQLGVQKIRVQILHNLLALLLHCQHRGSHISVYLYILDVAAPDDLCCYLPPGSVNHRCQFPALQLIQRGHVCQRSQRRRFPWQLRQRRPGQPNS
mmetsp:Transcript_101927/g.233428  ORF Transcript_101927/g.233428 Transcript_101927/m.233428 type:complete len:221 (-) Transcript_101927:69-731(-)